MANENYSPDVQQAVTNALEEQKKKKRKKRLIVLAVIAVVFIGLVAIMSSGSSDTPTQPGDTAVADAQKNEAADGKIGNYAVVVKSSELCKDYEGKPSIKITYAFTNNSSTAQSFETAILDRVYQDGVELESVWTLENYEDLDTFDTLTIQPGITKNVVKAYKLSNEESPLEVQISEAFSFNTTVLKTQINIT